MRPEAKNFRIFYIYEVRSTIPIPLFNNWCNGNSMISVLYCTVDCFILARYYITFQLLHY